MTAKKEYDDLLTKLENFQIDKLSDKQLELLRLIVADEEYVRRNVEVKLHKIGR